MRELLLTDARYQKVICYLADNCEKFKTSHRLSDKKKYNQAMACLELLSSVENTQYDAQYEGISIVLKKKKKEQIILCLIDLISSRREKKER